MKGLGCDVVEIQRVKKILEKHGAAFKNKVYTASEQTYCDSMRFPEIHYAARFAAKEAVSKALGSGIGKSLSFLDMSIERHENGKPYVKFSEAALLQFKNPEVLLSISHAGDTAFAVATWV
jgi:holo-[acyl-carrier protein] synthase